MSLINPTGHHAAAPGRLERAATTLLRGVGGDTEWWLWNRKAGIGHLRVAVTPDEHQAMPPGCATTDAGPSGPPRRRRP